MMYCSSLVDACRSRTRAGMARLRTVLSRLMMPSEQHMTARAHQRRSCTVASSTSPVASASPGPSPEGEATPAPALSETRLFRSDEERVAEGVDGRRLPSPDVPLRAERRGEGLLRHREEEGLLGDLA